MEKLRTMKAVDELAALLGFNFADVILDGGVADIIEAAVARIKAGGTPQVFPDSLGALTAEYFLQLGRFVREFDIPRDLPSRVRKAGEELGELAEAAIEGMFTGVPDAIQEEASDMINVGMDILLIMSGGAGYPPAAAQVIPFLIKNLDRKAEKYRQGRNRTEERR